MQAFQDRTAVVTGAASGLGRELAICCARQGMSMLLADVDEHGLGETMERLPPGTPALCQRVDVADPAAVDALAARAFDTFGEVGLLFNNAGVATGGWCWEATPQDWQWVLGVNLMGVAHGIRSFVPRMLAQGREAHVVNTSSAAGLISVPGGGIYCASKHAVVTLSECLHHELRIKHASIGVSVLCPSFIDTGIADSERSRPPALRRADGRPGITDERLIRGLRSAKLSAAEIAERTLEAVRRGTFYVLPHERVRAQLQARVAAMVADAGPARGWLPEERAGNSVQIG